MANAKNPTGFHENEEEERGECHWLTRRKATGNPRSVHYLLTSPVLVQMISACGLLVCLLLGLQVQRTLADEKPMRGVHLRLLPLEAPEALTLMRDANRTIVGSYGRAHHIIQWLSQSLGFTYSIVDLNYTAIFLNTTRRGAISYLMNGEADVAWGIIILFDGRSDLVHQVYPLSVSSFSLMVPIVDSGDGGAPWLPFQYQIWVLIIGCLLLIPLFMAAMQMWKRHALSPELDDGYLRMADKSFDSILRTLLHQGASLNSNQTATRIFLGAWCLSCFVLVTGYSSVLISFFTTSSQQPLIDTIYDLPSRPDVHVVVEEKSGADVTFTRAESGILRFVGQDLNRNPSNRCRQMSECMERVKSGRYVYVNAASLILFHMSGDFERTGQCSVMLSKESFVNILASFVMNLQSPYKRNFDEGMIRLWQTGLLALWRKWYMKTPTKCLSLDKKRSRNRPITKGNLFSAFVLLLIGCGLASLAFAFEMLIHRFNCPHHSRPNP